MAVEAAVLSAPIAAAAPPGSVTPADGELLKATLKINGRTHALSVEPRWTLQYVLRDRLGLMGTKSRLRTRASAAPAPSLSTAWPAMPA